METTLTYRLLCLALVLAVLPVSMSRADIAASSPSADRIDSPRSYDAGVSRTAANPWFAASGPTSNARELILAIRNAPAHGLSPERYGLNALLQGLATLETGHTLPVATTDSSDIAPPSTAARPTVPVQRLIAGMDKAFMDLATHLGQGIVDGNAVQRRMFHEPMPVNARVLLTRIRRGKLGVEQALNALTPRHDQYQRLSDRLRNVLTERATGLPRVTILDETATGAPLKHHQAQALRSRLLDTGDLDPQAHFGFGMDRALRRALQRFQRRHGLATSGRLDEATRRVLDIGVDTEIQALSLSLERLRWMPRDLGTRHVWVNIPDFTVQVSIDGQTRLRMAAVVGEHENPTPSFSQPMSYLEFSPDWTVPARIANEELLPREREQPGYLASRGFGFLQRIEGALVPIPDEEIQPSDFAQTPFPYVLRQQAGPGNALGRMKFMMPNRHAIYLHDTPTQQHFTLDERAYSHGCIRLSEPDALARLLLQEDGHDSDSIEELLRQSRLPDQTPRRVSLRTPVPTHLAYLTTWVDESGALQRRADVYDQDAPLLTALQSAGTLLSILQAQPATSQTDQQHNRAVVPDLAHNS